MKTVPSLIASSTIGVAAVGLALGKPESSRPYSKRRRVGDEADLTSQNLDRPSLSSRPSTSLTILMDDEYSQAFLGGIPTTPSTKSHRRPPLPQLDTQTHDDKHRPGSAQPIDVIPSGESRDEENKRESFSSRGSWMRRLSALPLSYSSTSQASGVFDPSLRSDSYSTKPSSSMSKPMLQFRNKLVKRNKPARASCGLETSQTLRSKFATIRRPATSHQRSILQQEHFEDYSEVRNETSVDTCLNPAPSPGINISIMERTSGKLSDGKISDNTTMGKRIFIDKNTSPTLVKPEMIVSFNSQDTACYDNESYGGEDPSDEEICHSAEINTSEVRRLQSEIPKHSQYLPSMQIGSSISWISRSRSLRGLRKDVNKRVRERCSSVPLCVPSSRNNESADVLVKKKRAALLPMFQKDVTINTKVDNLAQSFSSNQHTQTRIFPLPLIPVYQLSSLSDDLARIGLSSPSTVILDNSTNRHPPTPDTARELQTPFISSIREPLATLNCFPAKDSSISQINEIVDRASTLVGSDFDVKCLVSSEEDDADFQSETIFDSLRSGVTDSIRSHNPLLDSIFDETLTISDKYQRHKRCSVHDILKIDQPASVSNEKVEKSEGVPTLGKYLGPYLPGQQELCKSVCVGESISNTMSHAVFPRSTSVEKLPGSVHIHDDEDEDWTKDEESSDSESKELRANFQDSERIIPGCQKTRFIVPQCNDENSTARPEIPKNNVFDWSEPSSINRSGQQGEPPRPRTAHVKQIMDGRGGRALGRRGPSALHIRSQSVPVVPDLDATKLTSKFGTWGLGTKAISEDWDGDFEFDNIEPASSKDGVTSGALNGVLVPEAIKASQENIAGHVGQIREVCLLVEDLKRLRVLGKSQGLLDGEFAPLWQQAEGIIALAAPVEDEKFELNGHLAPISHNTTPNFGDDGLSGFLEGELNNHRDSLDQTSNPHVSLNGLSSQPLKSVSSSEDEDFGTNSSNWSSSKVPPNLSHPSPHGSSSNSTTEVARKVMESIHQQRLSSDPLMQSFIEGSESKMPFDTTTLKDLVHCAATLSRTLGDAVRAADCHLSNLESTRKLDSSPAFTRVFTDPTPRPPKNLSQSPGSNSNS